MKFNSMTDSMKFGPEWLRNLSSEGNTGSSSGGGSRYHLAEYRYGREEMLALFEQSLKIRPPATIASFPSLYVDQAMQPLTLSPMTEDENRLWTARPMPPGQPRGRGGSMDRGRGRGRGGSFHPGFNRSTSSYDEPVRSFDRSQSDRGWSERNGDLTDWGAGSSPRKEYGNSRTGVNISSDNWRRHRNDDGDADGWRTMNHHHRGGGGVGLQDKWNSSGTRSISGNWRDGDNRDEPGHMSDRQASNRVTWHSSVDNNRGPPHRKPWDTDDHLPEWATENPSESGGTFDASGAFHGSDEESPDKMKKSSSTSPTSSSSSSSTQKENTHTNSVLQKSTSQQNITTNISNPTTKPMPLTTSQSATNLLSKKKVDDPPKESNNDNKISSTIPITEPKQNAAKNIKMNDDSSGKQTQSSATGDKSERHNDSAINSDIRVTKTNQQVNSNGMNATHINKIDDEFHHMKEVTDDIVAKLILDDDIPKSIPLPAQDQRTAGTGVTQIPYPAGFSGHLGSTVVTTPPMQPPSLPPTNNGQDKWYYRDPQGEVQGPFASQEMAEWFRAGYFTVSLLVRRQCDERYFTLGDLVSQCGNSCPFLSCRLSPLKHDPVSMPPEIPDQIQMQQIYMQRLLQRHAEAIRALSQTEPWGGLSNLQQRELITQHMLSQPQVLGELSYIQQQQQQQQQIPNTQMSNPLMHMISQMQQANKLPAQPSVVDKPPSSISSTQQLDPLQQLIQQMGGLQSNIAPSTQSATAVPTPVPPKVSTPTGFDSNHLQEDSINQWLRQLAKQKNVMNSVWDSRGNPAPYTNHQQQQPIPPQQQQQQQWLGSGPGGVVGNNITPGIPHSMWDLPPSTPVVPPPIITPASLALSQQQQQQQQQQIHQMQQQTSHLTDEQMEQDKKKKSEQEKERKQKERKEAAEKEKKRKEQEQLEKLKAQKEAEERRKEEQRKREAERKAEEKKKEEERVRRELEKAKREIEEKRLREQEEKRKLKEQRKAEEEARKKAEEEHRQEAEEKQKREAEKKEQARRQAEALRKMQEQQQRTKVAPWCQTVPGAAGTVSTGLSLTEIQRAEKEKRAEQAALLQQQLQQQQQQKALTTAKELQEQQSASEKSPMQLKWATKNITTPKKVKSLAEIQAEEQEKQAKQAAEARLAQQLKEKETASMSIVNTHSSIWSSASQSLNWNTNANTAGFWDDSLIVQKSVPKPSTGVAKSSSTSVMNNSHQQQSNNNNNKTNTKSNKTKAKKDEDQVMKIFDKTMANNDEFTNWCTKTLATLNTDVDIPTFISFLRDIESPYEVKDYVRQYLGDNTGALQFANQFVERRSKVKNQQRAAMQYKDDLCQPAPAINPSTEFQEVKGKGKKSKKSKMMKVDSRCLGFSVTAAEDRINVGDRDYGDSI